MIENNLYKKINRNKTKRIHKMNQNFLVEWRNLSNEKE